VIFSRGARQRAPNWLRGGALLAAGILLAALGCWRLGVSRQARMHEQSALLMGTFVRLQAAGPRAPAALELAMAELERLDALWDYGLATSDVGRLNVSAGGGAVNLHPDTVAVLEVAQRYTEASGGAFDVTVGPLVDLWGFRPDGLQVVPAEASIAAARDLVGWADLRLDPAAGTAELLRPGMRVDLGGVGKGFAVDRAVQILRAGGVKSGLVDVGGNVYALGRRPDGKAWRVGIQHPRQPDGLLGVIPLVDASVATSGDYQRFFEVGGRRYHHLLDPATGRPAEGLAAVSIVASTGAEADAASTAAFVLGLEEGLRFVGRQGLEAVFCTVGGQVEVTSGLKPSFEAPGP
jgi:thiamine biosynthesis lipoprotein